MDSNETAVGRKQNRRVEIVILPNVTKVKGDSKDSSANSSELKEPKENLK